MNAPPFVRLTHKESDTLTVVFTFDVIGQGPRFVLFGATKGAAFSPASLIHKNSIKGEKEAHDVPAFQSIK